MPAARRRSRGFTLVELIVTLVVIGVLAGIASVSYSSTIARTHEQVVDAEVRSVLHEASVLAAMTPAEDINARWSAAIDAAVADLHDPAFSIARMPDESNDPHVFAYDLTDDWGVMYAGIAVRVAPDEPLTVFCRVPAEQPGPITCLHDPTDEGTATGENAALLSSAFSVVVTLPPPTTTGH